LRNSAAVSDEDKETTKEPLGGQNAKWASLGCVAGSGNKTAFE